MGSLGAPELLIIGVVLVLLFGATRLPQTAKGLAQSLRIFRHELRDDDSSDQARSGALPQGQSGQAQPAHLQQGYQQPGQVPTAGHQPDVQPHPAPQAPGAAPSEPHTSN
ncbi:sec-independent protein translocase protein TatA [Actinopolymorpha cephalotaxi]|uniref:Sec-independent protein translocase protein TatA n=1 Tax=Actinopolymorpha cephalotaxi TaxID=504797 RepID=A0A1I3AYB9_9ACTN|nr:twin-arginine translocase TatA/TatE family subunit [Actinopolymorpha cephalotaxi]NYH84291.1 sec-independent protein translocase protein TatA [Actinopolymorpha cephalotaxi]SFH55043.1 sec-independent protein translocase protein TatA [Actinopolymorpha cephalotaxi]